MTAKGRGRAGAQTMGFHLKGGCRGAPGKEAEISKPAGPASLPHRQP